MKNIKSMILGGIFAGFSVLFQTIPTFFSEFFAILTIFSSLPVYFMCRRKPIIGLCTFLSAAILTFIISPHEGIFFLFTNGIIGLSLGLSKYYFSFQDIISIIIGSFTLSTSISIMSIALNINVFGADIPFTVGMQLLLFFVFSIIYCTVFTKIANMVYLRVLKFCENLNINIL